MQKLNGKTISHLLKSNNITIKEAAEKMGIHYNNLSSIINGGQNYTTKTEQKVIDYFQKYLKINTEQLYSTNNSDILIRLKLAKQPAKNEIAIVREDLIVIERTIKLTTWMDNKFGNHEDYINERLWDIYTTPSKGYDLYDLTLRRSDFFELKKRWNLSSLDSVFNFLSSEDIQELLFRDGFIHLTEDTGHTIISLTEKLGIKIFFISLNSTKILSASTPFFNYTGNSQEPIIFINKNACKSPEEIILNIAKELYYILFKEKDFSRISDYKIEIEPEKCDGIKFAKKILFNQNAFIDFLNKNEEALCYYFPSSWKNNERFHYYNFDERSEYGWIYLIFEIKRYFRVSYKLIFSALHKMNFKNIRDRISEQQFCEYFISAIEKYNQSLSEPAYRLINGEPTENPFNYSIDNLKICLNCLENNKNMDDETENKYDEYKDLIEQLRQ